MMLSTKIVSSLVDTLFVIKKVVSQVALPITRIYEAIPVTACRVPGTSTSASNYTYCENGLYLFGNVCCFRDNLRGLLLNEHLFPVLYVH